MAREDLGNEMLLITPITQSTTAGAFSVEWEWAWHPELDPPEAALPAALTAVRNWLVAAPPPESVLTRKQASV